MSDLNNDELFRFVKDFTNLTKDDISDCMTKFIDVVPQLLARYPSDSTVMETVCKAIIHASVNNAKSTVDDDKALSIAISLAHELDTVNMTNQTPSFVHTVCSAAVHLLALFLCLRSQKELTDRLLNKIFNSFSVSDSPKNFIAVATSIPPDLPRSVYQCLLDSNVHSAVRSVISVYAEIDAEEFLKLLSILNCFVSMDPSSAGSYILDSTHYLLLFASQTFSDSFEVQTNLWYLLTALVINSSEFRQELNPEILLPAILPLFSNPQCSCIPVLTFLGEYVLASKDLRLFVLYCFNVIPEFIQALLKLLDVTRDLDSEMLKDEVECVARFLEMFFEHFKGKSTANQILDLRILHHLAEAAIQWPELCCVSFCTCIRELLGHFMPDLSSLHPALRKLMAGNDITAKEKEIFFKDNQLLPFIKLLPNPSTFPSLEIRGSMYDAIKFLLKHAPPDTKSDWLTDEFLCAFITTLLTDVKNHKDHMHSFVFVGHFIMYCVKEDRTSVIRDQNWHNVAVECLKLANNGEACSSCIGFVSCILVAYSQAFKDISLFTESDLPSLVVTFAEEYGLGPKSRAGDNFGSLALTLTADKAASVTLHKKGFLEELYPLIDDIYDPSIVRAAIHSIGNIALAGHHVKQEVLEKKVHVTLIDYLDEKMTTADPFVLSACCRVLHILASGDWAKRNFADHGLVDILLRMLDTRKDNAEVCWRPLGLLSSLGFMSLSQRDYIITEKVLTTVLNVLKNTDNSKVKSYTALVFLASVDSDRRSADLQNMKVTEIFQQVLEQTKNKDTSYDDLQRWGSSLLEKGHLFTIPLNGTNLKPEEMELLASCMEQSISWPEKPIVNTALAGESTDGTNNSKQVLPPDTDSNFSPKFPEGPGLTDNAISQLLQLSLNPDSVFRIGRFFGSSHGLCSNCDKDMRSEEIVFRPQNLTPDQYQSLITRGWYRRGGVKLYRYRYNHNLDCSDWETRVLISEFDHRKHKSYKKVLRRMPEERLTVETVPTQFIREAYELYNSYHLVKHDKPRKSEYSYCEHAVNSPFKNQSVNGFQYGTFHQLYRLDGKLVAVGIIDIIPNGVVSIYMWYDMSKEIAKYSFGVYSALKEIEFAKELSKCNPNIRYYYMQGWNGNNHKLSYKARYEPEEFYSPCTVGNWVFSLEGVKKEQDLFRENWLRNNKNPSLEDEKPSNEDVPGDAISLDRVSYTAKTGQDKPDILNTVVCLNQQLYMYFGQMLDTYSIRTNQRQLMIERFEELVLAVGSELAQNMVIDIVACPTTGDINEHVIM